MTEPVMERLAAFGVASPDAPRPLRAYRTVVQAGSLIFLSGQLPIRDGAMRYRGQAGGVLTIEHGRAAAELAALNALARIQRSLRSFARLREIVQLDGYVASAPGFFDHPNVLDAASELSARVLEDRAAHARTAFAVPHLPADAAVELVLVADTTSSRGERQDTPRDLWPIGRSDDPSSRVPQEAGCAIEAAAASGRERGLRISRRSLGGTKAAGFSVFRGLRSRLIFWLCCL